MPVSEPSKYTTLWAQSGIRFDIPPAADPATGKAGFDVGFSSINMASEAAGGIPPWGQDFNGIFYSLTKAAQYTQAGGMPTFDAALAAAVGGYAINAMVKADSGLAFFINQVPGNSSNPNAGGSGWVRFGPDSYGSPMIGVPMPWPVSQLPQDLWPDCGMVFIRTGEPFSLTEFPLLAALYPSGVTPSLKGKFIRGWDDASGVDAGRALLSSQKASLMAIDDAGTGSTVDTLRGTTSLVGLDTVSLSDYPGVSLTYSTSVLSAPSPAGHGGTRPVNVAFNMIIRAK